MAPREGISTTHACSDLSAVGGDRDGTPILCPKLGLVIPGGSAVHGKIDVSTRRVRGVVVVGTRGEVCAVGGGGDGSPASCWITNCPRRPAIRGCVDASIHFTGAG